MPSASAPPPPLEALAAQIEAGVARAQGEPETVAALGHAAAAAEAAIAAAGALIDTRAMAPAEGRARFVTLEAAGLIDQALRIKLVTLAGFRNLAVKQCSPMDLAMIEHALRTELGALTTFAGIVREFAP